MVVSAGNSGPGCSHRIAEPPSFYEASYTVGALNTGTDTIASFSSRGPVTIDGSNRTKPDITAPGTGTRSATNDCDTCYGTASGTSMATPHIAGAMALLWSAIPSFQHQIQPSRDALNNTAVFISSTLCGARGPPNNVFGWGRIDIAAAVGTPPPTPTVSPTPASSATPCGLSTPTPTPSVPSVTYTYSYGYGNSDGDSYTPSESNTYSERHHSSYAYTDGDCHSYGSAQGNPKASSDSASSAVSAEIRGEGESDRLPRCSVGVGG